MCLGFFSSLKGLTFSLWQKRSQLILQACFTFTLKTFTSFDYRDNKSGLDKLFDLLFMLANTLPH